MPNTHFLVVGINDAVLFEFDNWGAASGSGGGFATHSLNPISPLQRQFIAYGSLDALEEVTQRQGELFLPLVYRSFGEEDNVSVTAYVGLYARIRLLLLHYSSSSSSSSSSALEKKGSVGLPTVSSSSSLVSLETISTFFQEAYKLVAQYFLNPFNHPSRPLESGGHRRQLEDLCRLYL